MPIDVLLRQLFARVDAMDHALERDRLASPPVVRCRPSIGLWQTTHSSMRWRGPPWKRELVVALVAERDVGDRAARHDRRRCVSEQYLIGFIAASRTEMSAPPSPRLIVTLR